MLEDADRQGLRGEAREDLAVVRAHAQRVGRIVQSLLAFASHRRGERTAVDLNRVVEDTLVLVARQLEADGVDLRTELRPGLPPVHGDPVLLGQVLLNLLNNAREAVGSRGTIIVTTDIDTREPGGVRLAVRDTGPGISEELAPRVFEPFFTTRPAATGLGLAVCYGIVRSRTA